MTSFEDFTKRDESGLEWKDISSEECRVYVFGNKQKVFIKYPIAVAVSSSGGHRVYDTNGHSHYIPPRWIHLYWKAIEGESPFVF